MLGANAFLTQTVWEPMGTLHFGMSGRGHPNLGSEKWCVPKQPPSNPCPSNRRSGVSPSNPTTSHSHKESARSFEQGVSASSRTNAILRRSLVGALRLFDLFFDSLTWGDQIDGDHDGELPVFLTAFQRRTAADQSGSTDWNSDSG